MELHVPIGVLIGLCGIIQYILLLWFIRDIMIHRHEKAYYRINIKIKLIAILFMLCTTFTFISDEVHVLISYFDDIPLLSKEFKYIKSIANFWYFCESIILYIMLLHRVHIAFKESIYKINSTILLMFIMLICVSLVVMIFYCVQKVINANKDLQFGIWIFLLINDFVMNIGIMVLFIYKLRQIIVMSFDFYEYEHLLMTPIETETQNGHKILGTETSNGPKLETSFDKELQNKGSSRFVKIMAKLTVLGITSIVVNIVFYIFAILANYDKKNATTLGFIAYLVRNIQGCVNYVVIILTFQFNERIYFKMCYCWNTICYICCLKNTKRAVAHSVFSRSIPDSNESI